MKSSALACVAAMLCAGLAAAPALQAADQPISAAEQKLFLEDHLRDLGPAGVLHYDFSQAGSLDANYQDSVALTFSPGKDGRRSVQVAYLNGDRRIVLPALEEPHANPVILYFLEQDVREMHRRLGGWENYFRRRIRLAFANDAEVRPVTVDFEGRRIDATEVVVRPFVEDPMKGKLQAYENKRYAFTLSDRVPGGVVRISTRLPGDDSGKPTLLEETLTFKGHER